MDRFLKKNKPEWSKTGSLFNKPERGWIHPSHTLDADAGICYGVRYIGCIEVKESMKTLDFDTRTSVAREAINKVAEAAGLKTASRKKKDKRISKMLGDNPYMIHAGANVNLTVTVQAITLVIMETGEFITDHPMQLVSFASGGDADTLDFVAYVASDQKKGRACHVLECGDGLAEDVVTTIGQAFELRFKEHLKKKPVAVHIPDRRENPAFEHDRWGEDEEYYNDRPGARPPSPALFKLPPSPTGGKTSHSVYNTKPSSVPIPTYSSVRESPGNIDAMYSKPLSRALINLADSDFSDHKSDAASGAATDDLLGFDDDMANGIDGHIINNKSYQPAQSSALNDLLDLDLSLPSGVTDTNVTDSKRSAPTQQSVSPAFDPFDLDPFTRSLPDSSHSAVSPDVRVSQSPYQGESASREEPLAIAPTFEEWFHASLSRKGAEQLLQQDGDFLVRESSNTPGQYVLSGRQLGHVKHLLLVDPDGIVRTRDFIFDSVSHLINYHRTNNLPIMTQGSEILLIRPVKNSLSTC